MLSYDIISRTPILDAAQQANVWTYRRYYIVVYNSTGVAISSRPVQVAKLPVNDIGR